MTMATVIMVKGTSPVEMRIKAAAYDGQDITRGVRSAAVDVSCLTRIEGKTEGWKGVLPDAAFNFDKRRTAARVCKSTANFGVTVPSVRRSSLHGIIGIGNPCNTALLRRCRRSGTMDQRLQRRQTTWPAAPVVRAVDLHLDGKGDQEHHQAPLHSHIGLGSSSLESSEGLLANTFSEHFVPAQQPLGQMRASTSSSSSSSSSSSYCSYAYDPNSGAAMSTNSNTAVIATDAINTPADRSRPGFSLNFPALLQSRSLYRWRARLFTKQDVAHLHALSSVLSLVSFFGIEGLNLVSLWATGHFWEPSSWHIIEPLIGIHVVQQITGMVLAYRFRPPGAVQSIFISTSLLNLGNILCSLSATESYPAFLREPMVASTITFTMLSLMFLNVLQLTMDKDDIIASRKLERSCAEEGVSYLGLFGYFLPLFLPFPIMAMASKQLWATSLEWLVSYSAAHPGYYAFIFHNSLIAMFVGNVAPFGVTLRDKRLISPVLEVAMVILPPLMYAYFLYWSSIFQFPDWLPELLWNTLHMFDPLPPA